MNRLRIAACALLCAVGISALGQGVRYDNRASTVQTNMPAGANAPVLAIPSAKVRICTTAECIANADIFQDERLTIPLANPLTAGGASPTNLSGSWGFWAAPGTYWYKITTTQGVVFGPYPITLGGSGGSSGLNTVAEIPAGVINGSNPTFTLSHAPVLLFLDLNGVQMTQGVDFTISGAVITMSTIPQGGFDADRLFAQYFYGSSPSLTPLSETPIGAINGSNTAFTLTHSPIALFLVRNGVKLQVGVDFTITGSNLTMSAAPQTGDVFNAQYFY